MDGKGIHYSVNLGRSSVRRANLGVQLVLIGKRQWWYVFPLISIIFSATHPDCVGITVQYRYRALRNVAQFKFIQFEMSLNILREISTLSP